jgi:hypothetical protein
LKNRILGGSLFCQNKYAMGHSFGVTTIYSWLSSKTQISSPDAIFLGSVGFKNNLLQMSEQNILQILKEEINATSIKQTNYQSPFI